MSEFKDIIEQLQESRECHERCLASRSLMLKVTQESPLDPDPETDLLFWLLEVVAADRKQYTVELRGYLILLEGLYNHKQRN